MWGTILAFAWGNMCWAITGLAAVVGGAATAVTGTVTAGGGIAAVDGGAAVTGDSEDGGLLAAPGMTVWVDGAEE